MASWLLVLPIVGLAVPWFYNAVEPRMFGVPFFYWAQMAWVPVGVLCTIVGASKRGLEDDE